MAFDFCKWDNVKKYYLILALLWIVRPVLQGQVAKCNEDPAEPTLKCEDAPMVCELLNYCNTLPPPFPLLQQNANMCNSPVSLDNPHWFSFIALSWDVAITIEPSNCRPNPFTGGTDLGMQGAIVADCPVSGGFDLNIQALGSCVANPCSEAPFTLGTGHFFAPGRKYWVLLDGCGGSVCDYMITQTEGVVVPHLGNPSIIIGTESTCPGTTVGFVIDNPNLATNFIWSLNGDIFESNSRTLIWDLPAGFPSGTYELCLENAYNECFDLIEDNDYEPGSICHEFEVIAIPPTQVGPIVACAERGPYGIDGHYIFPPTSQYQYSLLTDKNCDSTIHVTIQWIDHQPEDEVYYVCEGDWPFMHPVLGPLYDTGPWFYEHYDTYLCDSSFHVTIHELTLLPELSIPKRVLECPGEIIRIDATRSKVIMAPFGEELYNVDYRWFEGNRQIGRGPYLDVNRPGKYVFRLMVTEHGLNCMKEIEFEISENHIYPEVPIISGPDQVCRNSEATYEVLNWNRSDVVIFELPGCVEVLDRDSSKITIRFVEDCQDTICVLVHTRGCPALNAKTCMPVRVRDELSFLILGDLQYCPGEQTRLTGPSGLQSYLWDGPNISEPNSQSILVGSPGLYTLFVEDRQGCTGSSSVFVEERSLDPLSLAGSSTFCPGGSTTIRVVPDQFIDYLWSNNHTEPAIRIQQAGQYSVTVTDLWGCVQSAAISISVQDSLSPMVGGDRDFCMGGSIELNAGSDFEQYWWNGTQGGPVYTVNSPGIIRLFVRDSSGCEGSTQIEVFELPLPVPEIVADRPGICPGDSLLLRAGPGEFSSYHWSNQWRTGEITIFQGGNYRVTVTDAHGCEGSASILITEYPLPQPAISGQLYFCSGEHTTLLVAQAYVEYFWSNQEINPNVQVNTSGQYAVTVTDQNGCRGSTQVFVEERDLPFPIIDGRSHMCAGDEALLTVQGSYSSYSWSGPISGNQPTLSVQVGGIYTVQVTDSYGCRATSSHEIEVIDNPEPRILGSETFCTGSSTLLDAGDYAQYSWTGPADFESLERQVRVSEAGIYTVTVVNQYGCIGVASISITEDSLLRVSVDHQDRYCEGDSARLLVIGDYASIEWSHGILGSIVFVQSGIYTVTVTDAYGCTGSATMQIEELPNPRPQISGQATFCSARGTLLDAGVWHSYQWSSGLGDSQTVRVFNTGIYRVTVTDIYGCRGETQFEATELDELNPAIDGTLYFCEGGSTTLIAEPGYENYLWLDDGWSGRVKSITSPGTYVLWVEDSEGCTGTGVVEVEQIPLPQPETADDIWWYCNTTEVSLAILNMEGKNWFVEWYSMLNPTTAIQTGPVANVNRKGLYYFKIEDLDHGCIAYDTLEVKIFPDSISDVQLKAFGPSCAGDRDARIEIDEVRGGVGPFTYWLNNSRLTGRLANDLGPGTYHVTVMDHHECQWDTSITFVDPPALSLDIGPDLTIELGESIDLRPLTNVPQSERRDILWIFDGDWICSSCPRLDLTFTPNRSGKVEVSLANANGCEVSDETYVTVVRHYRVFVPTAFSPDRNGINDKLWIYHAGDVELVKYFGVFDRWGNKVYWVENVSAQDENAGWDGTFKGKTFDPGVFYYMAELKFNDGEIKLVKGETSLLR